MTQQYRYAWSNNPERARLYNRRCELVGVRSRPAKLLPGSTFLLSLAALAQRLGRPVKLPRWDSVLVRFLDNGEQVVCSRRALRKVAG